MSNMGTASNESTELRLVGSAASIAMFAGCSHLLAARPSGVHALDR